jgi:hypothetical protein
VKDWYAISNNGAGTQIARIKTADGDPVQYRRGAVASCVWQCAFHHNHSLAGCQKDRGKCQEDHARSIQHRPRAPTGDWVMQRGWGFCIVGNVDTTHAPWVGYNQNTVLAISKHCGGR